MAFEPHNMVAMNRRDPGWSACGRPRACAGARAGSRMGARVCMWLLPAGPDGLEKIDAEEIHRSTNLPEVVASCGSI